MSYAAMADFHQVALSAGTASEVALPANLSRQYLAVQNNTSGVLYVGFGEAAATTGLQIPAGTTWAPHRAPTNAIHVMAATAGPVVLIEGR